MNKKTVLLLCFVLFEIYGALAQGSAILFGTVSDSAENEIEGVSVAILSHNLLTESNANGYYELRVPAGLNLQVLFSYVGRNKKNEELRALNPGEKFRLDVQLSGITELGAVNVSAERYRREVSTVQLDPAPVSRLPNPSGNFEGILKTIGLGLTSNNEMSAQYNVRGGNFDENLVYVNDIEIYRPFLPRSGQQEGLSFIHSELVKSVKFSAGGFEARYGDKMSSVLDIKYREPRKFGGSVNVGILGAQTHIEGATRNMRFSYLMGARYWTNKYLVSSLDVQGNYQPSFTDVQSLLSYHFNSRLSLSVLGSYAQNRYFMVPSDRKTTFGTVKQALQLNVFFDGSDLMEYRTATGASSLVYKPSRYTTLKLISSYFYSNENEFFTVEGAYRLSELETDLGSDNFGRARSLRGVGYFINNARNIIEAKVFNIGHRGQHLLRKGKHNLQWGAFFQTEDIYDKLKEWNYQDSAGYSQPVLVNGELVLPDYLRSSLSLASYRVHGYLQNSQLVQTDYNATLTYGLRANYWNYNSETVISPRVQFSFEPNRLHNKRVLNDTLYRERKLKKDWVIKAAYGWYYQTPFYRELRDFSGTLNPNIKAQRSIHYLLGGDMNFKAWGRPFKFVTEAYYKQLDNLIPYEIDNVRIRYFARNISSGYAAGVDFRINGEFVKGTESWASLSIMETKEIITGQFDKNGQAITPHYVERPANQLVSFTIMFQDYLPSNPSYKVNLSLIYGSGLPFGPPDRNRYNDVNEMPGYRRVDMGFSKDIISEDLAKGERNNAIKKFFRSMWVSLEVFNILDIENTISYTWLDDATGQTWAVPNYLTTRRINLKLLARF